MPTRLHPRTQSHRRAKVLPCKPNHRPSRHITSTTRLTGILLIGLHIPRGLATRPRRKLVRLRRLSVPALLRLESSRTSRRGKRAKMVWRHRRGVIAARPFVHIHSPFTAIYHDYCTCGIFFSPPPYALFICCSFTLASSPSLTLTLPVPAPFFLLLGSPHMHCDCPCLGLSLLDITLFRHKRSVIISIGTLEFSNIRILHR